MRFRHLLALLAFICLGSVSRTGGEEPPAGVGLQLKMDGGHVVVAKVLADSPAESSGKVHAGDRIVSVEDADGKVQQPDTISAAVRLLLGKQGTTVRMKVVPAGKSEADALAVAIVRGRLAVLDHWGDGKLLAEGVEAPDAKLTRLADQVDERLSGYRGKVVVLCFWATWCGPCQAEMAALHSLVRSHEGWKGKAVVLAASVDDTRDDAAKRVKAKGWDRTTNVWVARDVVWAYHINGIPTVYVIGPDGRIAATDPADVAEVVRRLLKE